MTLEEALGIVKDYRKDFYPECVDVGIALGDYIEGIIAGVREPEETLNKYESWAQLRQAGRVFEAETAKIARQKKFWEAVEALAVKAIGLMIQANAK
jgi:hypothetical protein